MMTQLPEENNKGKMSQPARIRSFLKTRQQQTEKFLKKLIDTNSHVRNVEGVNYCSELINAELSKKKIPKKYLLDNMRFLN